MTTNEVMSQMQPFSNNHPKDIAALFSQLQVSVDQAQQKTRSFDSKTSTLPPSSKQPPTLIAERRSLSSTSTNTSSPITPQHPSLMTCPCYHWLVSMDSEHCAMCDTHQDIISMWQTERIERAMRLRTFRRQLMDMTITQDQQQNDMMVLQRTILEHREAAMTRDEDIVSLQHDMNLLQTKYNDESAQIEAIEISKQAAKREIEELGHQLFKEAHDMVATEQQEKSVLQSSCDELKERLDQTQMDLDQVSVQLQALRMSMGRWGDHQDKIPGNNTTPITASPILTGSNSTLEETADDQSIASRSISLASSSIPPLTTTNDPTSIIPITSQNFLTRAKMDLEALQEDEHIFLNDEHQLETFEDDQQLLDFQDFMDSATSTSFSLKKLHGLPFIKMCLTDDIEPCLRFGPTPRMTNSKRILEAIQIKTCFVEKCPPGFVRELAGLLRKDRLARKNKPSIWDKFGLSLEESTTPTTSLSSSNPNSATGHYLSCATCGRQVMDNEEDASDMEQTLAYRFRISYFDEWACIDRYCADRLNSVMAFYGFMRKLRLGTYNGRSLLEVYQECSRHRLVMFLSRLGALPLSTDKNAV